MNGHVLIFNLSYLEISKSGDNGTEATPVPISNTEVKLRCADGTWRAAAWESKSSPVLILNSGFVWDFAFPGLLVIYHDNDAEWSSWQLVGLITRRSQVRILSPQP